MIVWGRAERLALPFTQATIGVGFHVAQLGSKWNNGSNCSPFYLNVNNTSGNRNRNISGQLQYVPLKKFKQNKNYNCRLVALPLGRT